jgi:protein SCO1/2
VSTKSQRFWLLGATAVVGAAFGVTLAIHLLRGSAAPPPSIGGYVLPEPRALPAVELIDDHGMSFTPPGFVGHWSFLYFGYTYCPDVCPLALIELASLKKTLGSELPDEPVEYYLVSVDPARDTPERLREYVAYFDPSFHGLTGSPADLMQLAERTGSVFFVPDDQTGDNYLVSHSSNVVLLDPDGRLHAVFTPPRNPAQLATDFAKIVARRQGRS